MVSKDREQGLKSRKEDKERGRRKYDAKYRIETEFGTSHRDFTRFTTFGGNEVQDWNRIGYFAPGIHTFYYVLRRRSTGLKLNLVLRARISHVLLRFERAKYLIGTEFGTSCRGLRREFTRFDVRPICWTV